MSRALVAVFASCLFVCSQACSRSTDGPLGDGAESAPSVRAAGLTTEDRRYRLYALAMREAIDERAAGEPIEFTVLSVTYADYAEDPGTLRTIFSNVWRGDPAAPGEDVKASYVAKNRRPTPVEAKFDPATPVRLIDETTRARYLDAKLDWEGFYRDFPRARGVGIVTLSDVGLSESADEALVFVTVMRGATDGAGFYMWFRRAGDEWALAGKKLAWAS